MQSVVMDGGESAPGCSELYASQPLITVRGTLHPSVESKFHLAHGASAPLFGLEMNQSLSPVTSIRWSDSRRFRVLIFSLLSLAAAIVAGLAWQTWRSSINHRESAERVLGDYASFAAWSFQSRTRTLLFAAANPVFGGADMANPTVVSVLAGMHASADSLERCRCGISLQPEFVFLVDFRSGSSYSRIRNASVNQDEAAARVLEIKTATGSSIARGVSSRAPGALPYRMVARTTAGVSWVAFYAVRFRDATDPGVIVGFESLATSVASQVLSRAFSYAPLLPPSLARGNRTADLLSVEVRDATGTSVFSSTPHYPMRFVANEPIGEPDTALMAIVSMNPTASPSLLIGGVPQSPARTILPLVSLAVVLLGLAFYLVSRREISSLEVRASLSEARLAALRSQIQPHFLFNVLNTIAMLARSGKNDAVLSAVARLSDLLRVLLRDPPREEIPLREEIDFVRQYLALEQERFGNRLTFTIGVPSNIESAIVPSLILQPLVENALIHGVGQRAATVSVDIKATLDSGQLKLEVRDTGPGLGKGNNGTGGAGIALTNSRERLRQLYGSAAKLEVRNGDTGGVVAVIEFPYKPGEMANHRRDASRPTRDSQTGQM